MMATAAHSTPLNSSPLHSTPLDCTSDRYGRLTCTYFVPVYTYTRALTAQIWTIGKTRPGFLAAAIGVATNRTPSSGGSMRHRCHISCELHEHHLNDAMRLHQAMLSNSALDIGTINLTRFR